MKHYLLSVARYKKILTIVTVFADSLFFIPTDPLNMPAWLLAIGFLLLAANVYIICHFSYHLLGGLGAIKPVKRWTIPSTSAFIFLILILQTIGQLSLRDIMALIPLVLIGHFYFTRVSNKNISY